MKQDRTAIVGVIGLIVVVAGGCAMRAATAPSAAMTSHTEASPAEAALLLYRAGVTPDALAAVGATEEQVGNICLAARIACSAQSPTYGELLELEAAQTARVQALTDIARAGRASREDWEALTAARGALAACRESQEDAADLVRLAANSNLNETQREWLWNIADARHIETPVAFKVTSRPDGEWRALRDDIGASRSGGGEVVPGEGDEASAQALYDMSIAWVSAAWDGALRPQ